MILKNKYSLIHRPEPPAHPFTSEALFQTISRLIPTPGTDKQSIQKPHYFNVLASESKKLSGELHATFSMLYPMGNIAPDQSGCIVTDGVHGPISNKL